MASSGTAWHRPASPDLLSVFPRIRIINLVHRADRRREIIAELARLGLTVDGAQIAFHVASLPAEAGGFPTVGTRGCFESHLAVLTDALARGDESICIFEDDLDFVPDFGARFGAVADVLATRDDWAIFYGAILRRRGAPSCGPIDQPDADDPVMGGHFVVFRRPAIERLVPYLRTIMARPAGSPEGGPMHVDGAYSWFRRAYPDLITLIAEPGLGFQRASRTDIHALKLHDRIPVIRDFVSLLRKIRRRKPH